MLNADDGYDDIYYQKAIIHDAYQKADAYTQGKTDCQMYNINNNPYKARTEKWCLYNQGYINTYCEMAEQCEDYNEFVDRFK